MMVFRYSFILRLFKRKAFLLSDGLMFVSDKNNVEGFRRMWEDVLLERQQWSRFVDRGIFIKEMLRYHGKDCFSVESPADLFEVIHRPEMRVIR